MILSIEEISIVILILFLGTKNVERKNIKQNLVVEK